MLVTGFRSARRLIAETDGDPRSRSFAIILGALALYHLLLANKQGGMLGNPMLFAFSIMLARVSLEWHHRWSEQQHFVEFNEFGESVDGSLEHFEPMEAGATR
jgi:hypothetical protein